MKYFSVIVFFLLVGLVVLYFSKESGHSREMREKEEQYKIRIDSIKAHYRELILEDSITFQHYADAKLEAERARNETTIWKRRYEHEKNNHRTFTSASIDSLLSKLPD